MTDSVYDLTVPYWRSFVAEIHSKATRRRGGQPGPAPMQDRPPTARPRLRPLARGVSGYARPWAQPLAARRSQGVRLQDAYKELSPAASPTASRGGNADRRGGRPLAERLPVGKGSRPLAERLPVGKGSRRLRRGSGGDVEGARGVRASF
ncbi:hypothetical protein GW17_00046732 [Ensete ventricosum]|nr:hypothetical protein GW17_00046732 [Ensete ventricosum]